MSSYQRQPASMPPGSSQSLPPQKPRKKKRRWIYRFFWLVVIGLVLIGISPYLASAVPFIRNLLLTRAIPNLNGSVTADDASLGWERPIGFERVKITSPMGIDVVQIEELKGTRPLWKILLKPTVLGTYEVVRPNLTMMVYENGTTSLSEVFTGSGPFQKEPQPPSSKTVPELSVAVKLVDGRVTVCDSRGRDAWVADPINFAFRLRPSTAASDGRARLEILKEKVFDHVQVTPEVCKDMLKFIAPVMADTTRTEGDFSIDLDNWSFPLIAPAEGEGKGVFTVHELSINAGPVIQKILVALGLSGRLLAIDEAPIEFELKDGRMRHKGLVFHVEKIQFTTSGSVGVKDESLDMNIVIQIPENVKIPRPLFQALAGQSITIPIRGTLKKPEVDVQILTQSGIDAFNEAVKRLTAPIDDTDSGKPETKTPGATEDGTAMPTIDPNAVIEGVEELLRRRQERLKEDPNARPFLDRDRDRDQPLLKQFLTTPETPEEKKE